jgi:hypothetical protein
MKNKTLIKKMTRQEASEYMKSSNYRFPTKEEVAEFGVEGLTYWTDSVELWFGDEYTMFTGQYAANVNNEVMINKESLISVLCIKDTSRLKIRLENILLSYKLNKVSLEDASDLILDQM